VQYFVLLVLMVLVKTASDLQIVLDYLILKVLRQSQSQIVHLEELFGHLLIEE
jgi:hypothetical protein